MKSELASTFSFVVISTKNIHWSERRIVCQHMHPNANPRRATSFPILPRPRMPRFFLYQFNTLSIFFLRPLALTLSIVLTFRKRDTARHVRKSELCNRHRDREVYLNFNTFTLRKRHIDVVQPDTRERITLRFFSNFYYFFVTFVAERTIECNRISIFFNSSSVSAHLIYLVPASVRIFAPSDVSITISYENFIGLSCTIMMNKKYSCLSLSNTDCYVCWADSRKNQQLIDLYQKIFNQQTAQC